MSGQNNPGSVVFGLLRKISRMVGSEGRALEVIQYYLNNEGALKQLIAMVPGNIGIVPRVKLIQTSKQHHGNNVSLSDLRSCADGYGQLTPGTYRFFYDHPELFPDRRTGVRIIFFNEITDFTNPSFRAYSTLTWDGKSWSPGYVHYDGRNLWSTDFAVVPA